MISPIGEENSPTRKRADQVLRHLIKPAAQECGFIAIRADEIDLPGIINNQIVSRVIDDPLVIADLTELNPNVFYELAVRHSVRRPLVQIIEKGESLPFDLAGFRTVQVDHRDLDSVETARAETVRQINEVTRDGAVIQSPISSSLEWMKLHTSEREEDRDFADFIEEFGKLRSEIRNELREMREKQDFLRMSEKTDVRGWGDGESGGIDAESRMRLRSIDVQLLRVLEEMSVGRQETATDIRADIGKLIKSIEDLGAVISKNSR